MFLTLAVLFIPVDEILNCLLISLADSTPTSPPDIPIKLFCYGANDSESRAPCLKAAELDSLAE